MLTILNVRLFLVVIKGQSVTPKLEWQIYVQNHYFDREPVSITKKTGKLKSVIGRDREG